MTTTTPPPGAEPSVLIVGAGIAGLMTASALPDSAHHLTIVDKGRSAGGRLATRRLGAGRADNGAQFFTVRTQEFSYWADAWQREGLVFTWSTGWSDGSVAIGPADGHPRYAVSGGMNAIARRLAASVSAKGAALHMGVRLQAISRTESGWWACSDDGHAYTAHVLVLTAPVPQSLALLDAGGVALAPDDRAQLTRIAYAPCLCAMLRFDDDIALPFPGALQRQGADIPWLADNRAKGISPGVSVLTAHASPEFSTAHYDEPDDALVDRFLAGIAPVLASSAPPVEVQIKRWRYAQPTTLHGNKYLRAADLPPLFFGGDAFGAPRVEGAALSGLAIAQAIHALA